MADADKLEKLARRARKARADSMERHVLVCTDSDCDRKGKVAKELKHAVASAKLRDRVTVTKVDCLDICKHGTICVVYPEGAWYHSVKRKVARRIVDEHLAGGDLVDDHVFLTNDLR